MATSRPHNPSNWQTKLVVSIGKTFRSKKAYSEKAAEKYRTKQTSKSRKQSLRRESDASAWKVNELGEREYDVFATAAPSTMADTRSKSKSVDYGDMMHRLAHHDSFDSLLDKPYMKDALRDPGFSSRAFSMPELVASEADELRVASLPSKVWARIASFLNPADAANLALSTKTLYHKLELMPFIELDRPENKHHKISFLHQYDDHHPGHLLCFPCARYHRRSLPGNEKLTVNYVTRPIFECPSVRSSVLPRMRLTYGRNLPYAFVQLALRHERHSPNHGISYEQLGRRWKCKESGWDHRTRYMIHNGHLLLRVVSQTFAPPSTQLTETAMREILYERDEYTPYFSTCAHWRDGELMNVCKCMMGHVPAPPESYYKQLQKGLVVSRTAAHPNFLVTGCDFCRPARRCLECPTEYLIEVRMGEDSNDKYAPFKHAIVVTRWSDLGDGSSPYTSPEWAAINGVEAMGYDSFTHIGRRSTAGVFESRASGEIPGQRLISLNPKGKKLGENLYLRDLLSVCLQTLTGEDDHGWY